MLTLRPMTEAEFERYYATGVDDYAQERARNLHTSLEQERVEAARQYAELLEDGLQTPDQHLWSVTLDTGEAVGMLWVSINPERRSAFIFDIAVDPAHRGKGYGRQTLTLLEDELRPMGITRIGLNVFSDNDTAINLYRSQGYSVTNFNMQKDI